MQVLNVLQLRSVTEVEQAKFIMQPVQRHGFDTTMSLPSISFVSHFLGLGLFSDVILDLYIRLCSLLDQGKF